MMLPKHGKIACTTCFQNNNSEQIVGTWRLDNNPGAWGSTNPTVLVLGFSKGANQTNIWDNGIFEDVPFAGIRERLKTVLVTAGLLDSSTEINNLFSPNETRYAFGSLLRCCTGYDQKGSGKYATSGAIISRSFKEEPACTWIRTCAQKHLVDLPTSTHVIVMLGVANSYLENCWQLISGLYEDATRLNDVAYKAGGILFVHLAHPSGANGTFGEWCDMSISAGQGIKRSQAIKAIRSTLDLDDLNLGEIQSKEKDMPSESNAKSNKVKTISYQVKRGKLAGETLSPILNKDNKYIVSKTRFSQDQLYVDS